MESPPTTGESSHMESPPTTGEVRLALSTALGTSQECGGRRSRDAESLTLELASEPQQGWQR